MKAKVGDSFLIARWLIGARVEADGKTLGHVIDLEIEPQDDFRVSSVELGRVGWLDRMRLIRPLAHGRTKRKIRVVRWEDVERLDGKKLICRPGTKVFEHDAPVNDEPSHPSRTPAGG
jgi:hypothetical protein